jgi:hypothetical protein
MADVFSYPIQGSDEPDNEYWERVRQAGLPFPWEVGDKVTPPGPISVSYEWSIRPPDFDPDIWPTWIASETEARPRLAQYPHWTLTRRVRWVAVGDWEDVEP